MTILNSLNRIRLLLSTPKDFLYSFTYSNNDPVTISDFNPQAKKSALSLINQIKIKCPGLKSFLIGSVGLGIPGQNDIDIYAIGAKSKLASYRDRLSSLVGKLSKDRGDELEWNFSYDSFSVELILTSSDNSRFQSQLRLFQLLKNKSILRDYAALKRSLHGKSRRRYALERIIFFNRLRTSSS